MAVRVDGYGIRRAVRLYVSALAGALGVGFAVAGIELAGMGIGFLLDALGVADLALPASAGELLGAVLVLAALGWFFLGTAWEGFLPRAPHHHRWGRDELSLAWLAGVLIAGTGLTAIGWATGKYAGNLWPGLYAAGVLVWSAGWAGLSIGPLVVGAIWGARRLWPAVNWESARMPVTLVAWAVGAALVFSWAGGVATGTG